jgi:hypothetical protein
MAEDFTKIRAYLDGKRFIVKADDLLTAFLSLERDAIAPKGANGDATRENVAQEIKLDTGEGWRASFGR